MHESDVQLAQSCGQIRPMILHARHQDHRTHSKYVVTKPYAIIGRNSSCDICLNHEDVSKQHAYLQVLDGKLFCVDQGSRHGIFWKDTPQLYGWVQPGQPIEIGPFEITLEQSVGVEAGTKSLRNTAPFFARYSSKVPSNAVVEINGNKKFDVRHQLALIGRCKHCNIILDTDEISPIHASIVRTIDGKYWLVVPIGIKVKVNGKRCVSMELHNEDVITIGNHTLTFKIEPVDAEHGISKKSSGTINLQADESGSHSLKPAHTPAPSLIEIDSSVTKKLQHIPVVPQQSELSQSMFLDRSSVEQLAQATATPGTSSAIAYRPVTLPALAKKTAARASLATQHKELAEKKPEGDTQLVNAFMHHMKLMQQEMMTQMRMNMEMMAEFMVNLQQQHMDQVREEMNHLAKINQELIQLRQSLVTPTPNPELIRSTNASEQKQLAHHDVPASTKPEPPPQIIKSKIVLPVHDTTHESHEAPSHDWITKRIAILEDERQSRWEKMKSAVFGK